MSATPKTLFLVGGPENVASKFTELDQAAEYCWERHVPRDLLSKARKEAEQAEGQRGAA